MLKHLLVIPVIGFFVFDSVAMAGDEHAFISLFERRQEVWDLKQEKELADDFQDDARYFDADGKE